MLTLAHSIHTFPRLTETWITTQIRHLPQWHQVVWSQYQPAGAPAGVTVRTVPGRPWLSVGESVRRAYYPWRYGGLVRHDRPAAVLAHFADEAYRILPTAIAHRLPLIVRCYGYDVSSLPAKGHWLTRLQRLFRHGAAFLAEGPGMAARLRAMGCPADKVRVIPLGVATAEVPWHPRQDDGVSPVRILLAASLREKKGHTFALSALATVLERHPRLEVTVIGDGPLRRALHDQVAASPLAGRVRWLGAQSHQQLLTAMTSHHLFLHPSVTAGDGDSEGGAPLVLLEAQASGLPVISSIHADIPQVVRPGITGLLAPERDVPALVTAIDYLLSRPDRWAAMGQEGRRFVAERFDPERLGADLAALVGEYSLRKADSRQAVHPGD